MKFIKQYKKMGDEMDIQLMTDGGADIPKRISDATGVKIVPLYIHFNDEHYKSDAIPLSLFFQKIKDSNELPRSAAPSPNDFYEAYKQVNPKKPIIMLSLSQNLSSTYENAVIGKNMLLEEEPDRKIEVINTKTASCGIALLLHESHSKMQKNMPFEELVSHLHERVEQTSTLFVLKTLENLILGGRLDKVRGTIAKTLNIKLLMQGNDQGEIEVTERVRGDKRAVRRFIEQIGEFAKTMEEKVITMSHCAAEERATSILERIMERYPFKDAYLSETGTLISTYGGEEALIISFFND